MGFRSRSRSSTFSITQFLTDITNANPHAGLAYVPSLGREMLYSHQISMLAHSQPNAPFALGPRSIFVSGICDTETTARKVFLRLTDAGILEGGCVRTAMIDGKKFAHQVKCLVISRQRDLVDLLFWWEEECMRLRKLLDSEKELGRMIKGMEREVRDDEARGDMDDDGAGEIRTLELEKLRFEREKMRMRVRQRPSERREDVEAGRDTLFEEAQRVTRHLVDEQTDGGVDQRRRTQPVVGRPPPYRA